MTLLSEVPMSLFLIVAIANNHKPSDFKQYKLKIWGFWRSPVWNGVPGPTSRHQQEHLLLQVLGEDPFPGCFQLSEAGGISGLVAPSTFTISSAAFPNLRLWPSLPSFPLFQHCWIQPDISVNCPDLNVSWFSNINFPITYSQLLRTGIVDIFERGIILPTTVHLFVAHTIRSSH